MTKKNKCNRICFIPVGVRKVIRILVGMKNLWQYKKLPLDKFVEKKRIFCKTFCSKQNFSELQCLVDNLVDFLELSMFL